jgi:magnesium transporter
VSVSPDTDQEQVAQLVDKYDLLGVPVVDEQTRLLGMVTVDDVIDALQEEHSEDVSRFAGTSAETLVSVSSLRVARLRLPWLIICLFGTFVSAMVIRAFEGRLEQAIGLAAFIPVIAAMSGNSGLQTATIVVRGMALGVIHRDSLGRLLGRETVTALVIGVCCGLLAGTAGWLIMGHWGFGPVVAVAMTLAIMWSTTVGTIIPFAFNMVGIDPALSSGPLVTTLNDSFSLLIYFAVATAMMVTFPGLLG